MSGLLLECHFPNTAILTVFHSLHKPVWVTLFSPAPRLHARARVDLRRSSTTEEGRKPRSISDGVDEGGVACYVAQKGHLCS